MLIVLVEILTMLYIEMYLYTVLVDTGIVSDIVEYL